jgi:hypothetical protein
VMMVVLVERDRRHLRHHDGRRNTAPFYCTVVVLMNLDAICLLGGKLAVR